MRKALILLNGSESLFFFHTELDVLESIIRKTDQIRSDRKRELSEADLAVRVVTQTPQDGVDVFFKDLLLEFKQEVFNVFEVQEAKVATVDHTED